MTNPPHWLPDTWTWAVTPTARDVWDRIAGSVLDVMRLRKKDDAGA